jgi:hypothetical protein
MFPTCCVEFVCFNDFVIHKLKMQNTTLIGISESGTMPINYFAQGLHWKISGKQENRTRNKLKIPLGISI